VCGNSTVFFLPSTLPFSFSFSFFFFLLSTDQAEAFSDFIATIQMVFLWGLRAKHPYSLYWTANYCPFCLGYWPRFLCRLFLHQDFSYSIFNFASSSNPFTISTVQKGTMATSPAFSWRNWEDPRKTSIKIASHSLCHAKSNLDPHDYEAKC
jgi:hypothetical protein